MVKTLTFDGQHEDEEVLMVFRRHPIVMRKGLWALLVFELLGSIPVLLDDTGDLSTLWWLAGGLGLGALVLFYYWIGWWYSIIIVTDQRLVQMNQKGLFNSSVVDVGLDKIQNINFQIGGFTETILKYGTIVIQTFVGDLVIEQVHHPHKIQEKLVKIIKDQGYANYFGGKKDEDGEEDE